MHRFLIAVALVLVLASTGRADFVLAGSDYLEVNSTHSNGILFDSSTANVVAGGEIGNAYVNDASSLAVSGGNVGALESYSTSNVDMSAGRITNHLYSYDTSSVVLSGGEVGTYLYSYDTSSVVVSGAKVDYMAAYEMSSVNVSGGEILRLASYETTSVDISGGYIDNLVLGQMSTADISGGDIGGVSANEDSSVTFFGYDFRTTDGLSLDGDMVVGTGLLMGKWQDGTQWFIHIGSHPETSTIRVNVIPEPSTIIMLLTGALGLLFYRLRKT